MKKLYKYNYYDEVNQEITGGQPYKTPFVWYEEGTQPSDYSLFYDLAKINDYWNLSCKDKLGKHFGMKDYFYNQMTWAGASDSDKQLIIDEAFYTTFYDANADTNKVTFLMSPAGGSMTQQEAADYLLNVYALVSGDLALSCQIRSSAANVMKVVGLYLDNADAIDMAHYMRDELQDYQAWALIGTGYSDTNIAALTDKITSKAGTVFQGNGLAEHATAQGYTLKGTYTIQDLIDALVNLFILDY